MLEKKELNKDSLFSTIEISQFFPISNFSRSLSFWRCWWIELFFSCYTLMQTFVKGLGKLLLFAIKLEEPEESAGEAVIGSFFEVFLTMGFIFWLEGIWALSYCFRFGICCPNWLEFFLLFMFGCGVLFPCSLTLEILGVWRDETVLKFFYKLLINRSATVFLVWTEVGLLWASSTVLLRLRRTYWRVLTELRN